MAANLKQNITRSSIWLRLVYMIIFGIAFNVAEFVILAVAVFQFLASLFTGEPNVRLARFGQNLAQYIRQIIAYVSFASEDLPFPFSSWPEEPPAQPAGEKADGKSAEAKDAGKPAKTAGSKKPATRKVQTTPKTGRKRSQT